MKPYSLAFSIIFLFAGCHGPKTSWSFSPEAPNKVSHARQVAVVLEFWSCPTPDRPYLRGPVLPLKHFVNELVSELEKRGYKVTVLTENFVRRKEKVTIPAKTASEVPEGNIFPSKTEMARRYRAAETADLLLEFFVYYTVEWENPSPRWPLSPLGPWPHHCRAPTMNIKPQRIILRISDPRNQAVLGTCRVEHPSALRDVLKGLDKVREGKHW